jgi:hypothetical protein
MRPWNQFSQERWTSRADVMTKLAPCAKQICVLSANGKAQRLSGSFAAFRRSCLMAFGSMFALLGSAFASFAQASELEDFYKGKSVDLIIASEAEGGCDLYARLIAPFL